MFNYEITKAEKQKRKTETKNKDNKQETVTNTVVINPTLSISP